MEKLVFGGIFEVVDLSQYSGHVVVDRPESLYWNAFLQNPICQFEVYIHESECDT